MKIREIIKIPQGLSKFTLDEISLKQYKLERRDIRLLHHVLGNKWRSICKKESNLNCVLYVSYNAIHIYIL